QRLVGRQFIPLGLFVSTKPAAGQRGWLSDRAAFMYSLPFTAKVDGLDPQAWLADVLARLSGTTASRVPDLLPWNWQPSERRSAA
ncbi:transposase domain-containing protein, partial [Salipiger sp. D13]|uniref:transposase domain-containing protein n=1 Tax=Salipiger sp. D13 TaxID=2364881 RepID=UPI00352D4DC7